MRILIVEDQSLMLETILRKVKEVFPKASISHTSSIDNGKKLFKNQAFNLVISDLDFDGEKRFAIAEEAKKQKVPCIIYSAHCNESFVYKARKLNVRSYVCKLGDVSEFRQALTQYNKVGWWTCSIVKSKLCDSSDIELDEPELHGAEEKIIQLMLAGKERNEIAKELKISKDTLYNYISKMIKRNECSLEKLIHRYLTWKKYV